MLVIVNKVDRGKLERGESAAGRKISPPHGSVQGRAPFLISQRRSELQLMSANEVNTRAPETHTGVGSLEAY